MRDLKPPFRFDVGKLVQKATTHTVKRVDGVTINLPSVSFPIHPDDIEQEAAREILIRLGDKRVLNARECCDTCIKEALVSHQEIRSLLRVSAIAHIDTPKVDDRMRYHAQWQLEAYENVPAGTHIP